MNILPNNQFEVNLTPHWTRKCCPTKIFNYLDIKDIVPESHDPHMPPSYIETYEDTMHTEDLDPFFGYATIFEISQEDAITLINLFRHLDVTALKISNTTRIIGL